MIVLDASAAVAALLNAGASRRALAEDEVHVPHLIDSEIASAMRRQVMTGRLTPGASSAALETWARLGVTRHPTVHLLARVWALRAAVSAYDAAYVALAESLECHLVTVDARLSRAPGLRCPVTVLPG